MLRETSEWVAKAEGDIYTARRELQAREFPNYDAACFHAQQSAEKYFKARLTEAGVASPRTHDLEDLLDRLLSIEPAWEDMRGSVQRLTEMAVEVRYPGFSADLEDAVEAAATAERVRARVRPCLGLSD